MALGGADVVARDVAEDELTARVARAVPGEGPTTATIDSFPFLARLVVSGEVQHIRVHQEAVEANGIRFSTIDVDLRGVRVDRGRLLRSRQVDVTGIDRGTVTAVVGLGEIARLAGEALSGGIRLEDGTLVIGDVRIGLAGAPLLPCATGLRFQGASIVVTCTLDDPPAELLRDARRRLGAALPVPSAA